MKVLMATINYDHPQIGMEKAFKEEFGADNVTIYDYFQKHRSGSNNKTIGGELLALADKIKPDWIWLQLQDTGIVEPEVLLKIKKLMPKCVITHWTGDARPVVGAYLASICKSTDYTFTSAEGLIKQFKDAGAKKAHYLQIGIDYDEDVLGIPPWTPSFPITDVVLCANYYGNAFPGTKERMEAISALKNAGINVGIVGSGWPSSMPAIGSCGVKQQHHIYKKCKVALSINNFNQLDRYYSDRQIISMASGKPVVCHYIPRLELEFENKKHCIWYKTIPELISSVKELLNDQNLRETIGSQGKDEIVKNHKWNNRIHEALNIIGLTK
jgi:hypothetical protein